MEHAKHVLEVLERTFKRTLRMLLTSQSDLDRAVLQRRATLMKTLAPDMDREDLMTRIQKQTADDDIDRLKVQKKTAAQALIQKKHDEAQISDTLVQLNLEGRGLQQLEESLLELHTLFQMLNVLQDRARDSLRSIEDNVDRTIQLTADATASLEEAQISQGRNLCCGGRGHHGSDSRHRVVTALAETTGGDAADLLWGSSCAETTGSDAACVNFQLLFIVTTAFVSRILVCEDVPWPRRHQTSEATTATDRLFVYFPSRGLRSETGVGWKFHVLHYHRVGGGGYRGCCLFFVEFGRVLRLVQRQEVVGSFFRRSK